MLTRVLRNAGHRPISVETAESALELVRHPERAGMARIDLLVTDAMLPHVQGAELARRARALRPGLPVLNVTGHPAAFPPEHCRRATDQYVLRKPFPPDDLLQAVSELLGADQRH